jgi:hypothetical protein
MVTSGAVHENERLAGTARLVVQLDPVDTCRRRHNLPDRLGLSDSDHSSAGHFRNRAGTDSAPGQRQMSCLPQAGKHVIPANAQPQLKGPAEGESWLTLDTKAHENRKAAYIPQEGDRIAMRGRWIIDCGHNDFHTELHPITFMAFGHAVGSKTVVHVISNPYRVTQLYGFGTAEVNSAPKGAPFPQALEETITSVTEKSIAVSPRQSRWRQGSNARSPRPRPGSCTRRARPASRRCDAILSPARG